MGREKTWKKHMHPEPCLLRSEPRQWASFGSRYQHTQTSASGRVFTNCGGGGGRWRSSAANSKKYAAWWRIRYSFTCSDLHDFHADFLHCDSRSLRFCGPIKSNIPSSTVHRSQLDESCLFVHSKPRSLAQLSLRITRESRKKKISFNKYVVPRVPKDVLWM